MTMQRRALLLLGALVGAAGASTWALSGGTPRASGPAPSPAAAPPEEYPDFVARELRRLAAEPRPVENSALPPRHLDASVFPASLVDRTRIVSMTWHEIVNDRVGGVPVAVTYCPPCNSGIAFDRRVGGRVLDFGTSGALYQSALVMYDRQTESLWTHFDGRAVVGTLLGERLRPLAVATVSWREFVTAHPGAPVLTRDTGFSRPYGRKPYVGYDRGDGPLTGFFTGDVDNRLPAMTRVVGVHVGGDALAVTTKELAARGVIAARVDGRPVTVWHLPGTASSLHRERVADGDDVGATGVFYADHPADPGGFSRTDGRFVDERTGSTWNILGEAVSGPLAGRRLTPVPHVDTFWFAWSAYRAGTDLAPG